MKIICLGDSLTAGYLVRKRATWPALLALKLERKIDNQGIIGDTSSGVLARLPLLLHAKDASHIVIMAGSNDLIQGVSLNVVQANIFAMLHQIIAARIIPIVGIPTPVDILTAPKFWGTEIDYESLNLNLFKYREWLLKTCAQLNFRYLDFYQELCSVTAPRQQVLQEYYLDGLHLNEDGHKKLADSIAPTSFN